MKKALTLLSIVALMCVFTVPAAFAANYTLTVKSKNPYSGVGIAVSPNDRNGKGNGTTQFTRSYSDSTEISLTAPETANGNTFQKWVRDGVYYSANRTIKFKLSRNRTLKAVYRSATTTSYTLTVASLNPSSGVAITVSPNDRNAQGSGTTQFTRSYTSGTAVTLNAPASSGSNTFQKWQRNGADFATTRTATLTVSTNETMTAVYAAAASPHASLTWTGYTVCLGCHTAEAMEVQASAHYQWEGQALDMTNGAPVQGKLKTAVNSYCGNIIGNWGGCSTCHVGLGRRPDDATLTQQQHLNNIDCLICHQKDYKRKKDPVTGLMIPDTANMTITMDQAVKTVHTPTRSTCLTCHAKGGGGDNNKRGDMSVAHATTKDRNFDVHMASTATGNLTCQKCHTVQQHKIAGRGSDLRETDLDMQMTCSTSTCHLTKTASEGHSTSAVNRHIARVACQTCHIKQYARDAADTAANESTEMTRDWSVPEWSPAANRWEPTITRANNVKPEYAFWNGTSWGYSLNEPAAYDAVAGRYLTSVPEGDINGTGSKIYPFKYKIAQVPYATNLNILIPIETKTYFSTAGTSPTGVADSIKSALRLMGYSDTEPYTWVEDDTFQLITHEVPPASGNVLTCTQCHVSATATQMNLKDLGYATKKPTSDLCNDCHSLESYDGSYSRFTEIHTKHVTDKKYDCSRCHTFSRPERSLQ